MAMGQQTVTAARLAARLRELDCSRVVHFHCDHFEPFGTDGQGRTIQAEHVEGFLRRLHSTVPWSRPSLFFSSQRFYYERDSWLETSRTKDDQEILGVLEALHCDVHVHIHHEYWTRQLKRTPVESSILLQQLLDRLLPYMAECLPTAFNPQRWAFVHGCWGLQASDASVCNVEDELSILMQYGCIADMTFPPGRVHCAPRTCFPHSVLPAPGPKGYDAPAALPAKLSEAACTERLLIWNSATPFGAASLDTLCEPGAPPSSESVLTAWLHSSNVVGRTLYIKTHAHSMQGYHWTHEAVTPLLHPRVEQLFKLLQAASDAAGVVLEYRTATDVLNELRPETAR